MVRSSGLERRIARVASIGLLLVLIVQAVQSSIFGGINQLVFGESAFDRLNVAVHASIILIAVTVTAFRHALARYRAVWLVAAAYGGVVVASTGLNIQPVTEARMTQALLIPLTILSLGVALPAILDLDDYRVLFRGVVVFFALSAVVSLWLVFTAETTIFGQALLVAPDSRGGRFAASGLYSHRNAIGSFLEYIPALIWFLSARRGSGPIVDRRPCGLWIYIAAMVLILAHLLLTFSRSAQIVAALSLLPLLVTSARTRPRVTYVSAAVLAALVVVGVATIPAFQGYVGLGLSLMGRRSVWRTVLAKAAERPLLGFGLLNVEFHTATRVHTPHNAYLAQFAYFGLAGLALFLTMLVTFGGLVHEKARSTRDPWMAVLVSLLVAVLLQGLVEYILTFPVFFANSMFWICLGLAGQVQRPRPEARTRSLTRPYSGKDSQS